MKKILTIIAFALISVSMSAKVLCVNTETGHTLEESNGVYSIRSITGVITLGDLKEARSFMVAANKCFAQEKLKNTFDVGDQQFTVKEDSDGLYITKISLGVVKIRPSDTSQFYAWLESRIIKDKAKKVWDIIKE